MKIAWITVNYKQERFLDAWLHSIKNQVVQGETDIFIVDNSYTFDKKHENVIIFRPESNLGYFGGFNYCLERINLGVYDAVVFCNPDVTFEQDFSRLLRKYIFDELKEEVMILAPRITLESGVEQNPHSLKRFSKIRQLYFKVIFSSIVLYTIFGGLSRMLKSIYKRQPKTFNKCPIYLAHGACFVATKNFFRKHVRLNQQVFLWGEEVFLMNQISQTGGQILFLPVLRVFHHEHSATRFIKSRERFNLMKKSYSIYKEYL
jgi:GT2 family glycosyltransferase